jgi:hypothetical protein
MRGSSLHRRGIAFALSLALLAIAALAAAALASPASALAPRFTLNDGATYSRRLEVKAGDDGYTPFFRPAVVVWDGGSIIAGHWADPGFEFPAQTLSVLPHVCESYVSATGGAKIADMLVEGPVEVDARYRANADLDLCVVLAGGGDFRAGLTAADVYQSLRTYCGARRAAGFRVVVLSVLPCDEPGTFEASRLAYNAMLRDTWTEFADGFADVAGDPRIGDAGDDLDQQFYQPDALHLTNAGYAVMAHVAAPVLEGQPWLSSSCQVRFRETDGQWGDWRPYAASTTLVLPEGDGPRVVQEQYRLAGGSPVTVADDIFVDTVRPTPLALRDVVARGGRVIRLPFRVDDAQPCGPTSTVTVAVTTLRGHAVKTLVRRLVPVGRATAVKFTGLGRGKYRYTVSARDTAGNRQSAPGRARLTVR